MSEFSTTPPHDVRLARLYDAFNQRRLDDVLAMLHPEVDWPNGWEGGWLHGREAVREYWVRQWAAINPTVDPVGFRQHGADQVGVTVHQVVRDLGGAVLVDTTVTHTYTFDDGLIRRMMIAHPDAA